MQFNSNGPIESPLHIKTNLEERDTQQEIDIHRHAGRDEVTR